MPAGPLNVHEYPMITFVFCLFVFYHYFLYLCIVFGSCNHVQSGENAGVGQDPKGTVGRRRKTKFHFVQIFLSLPIKISNLNIEQDLKPVATIPWGNVTYEPKCWSNKWP